MVDQGRGVEASSSSSSLAARRGRDADVAVRRVGAEDVGRLFFGGVEKEKRKGKDVVEQSRLRSGGGALNRDPLSCSHEKLGVISPPLFFILLTLRCVGTEVPVASIKLEERVGRVAQGGSLKAVMVPIYVSIERFPFLRLRKNGEKTRFSFFSLFSALLLLYV